MGARGGKWSWSDNEVYALIGAVKTVRDRAMIAAGVLWGYRISELLSLQVKDVVDAQGNLCMFITVPSERLKGGKPSTKSTTRKRRPPENRTVPMTTAASFIQSQLDYLAKTRGGVYPDRYLFESRKRDKAGQSRPISRQQAWTVLKKAMRAIGMGTEHFATHSLRKTSARKYMEKSKRLDFVRDWLGHRSSATTDAYLRSDNTERLAIAAAIGEDLFKQVA